MFKFFLSLILVFCLFFSPAVYSASKLLTKTEDISKIATYGLNYATYTMEKENLTDAASKLASCDLLWDAIGTQYKLEIGEKMFEYSDVKDKVLFVFTVLEKVQTIAQKAGAGNYDEAAFDAVDVLVAGVNHPVINVLWEGVKLAYKSHKEVQETKAAVEIERIYYCIDKDRRLKGTGTPPLIPENATTADYFYEKYIITNTQTRELVKTYVKKVLGEQWPETSSLDKAYYYILGVDGAANYDEITQIEEFKNQARNWIMQLVKDLNNQVIKNYEQTQINVKLVEFEKFKQKFNMQTNTLEEVYRLYKERENYLKEVERYPVILAELTAKLEESKKKKDRDDAKTVANRSNIYAANCGFLNKKELRTKFEMLADMAAKFVVLLDEEIKKDPLKIVQETYPLIPPKNEKKSKPVSDQIYAMFEEVIKKETAVLSDWEQAPIKEVQSALTEENRVLALKLYNTFLKSPAPAPNENAVSEIQMPKFTEEQNKACISETGSTANDIFAKAQYRAKEVMRNAYMARYAVRSEDIQKMKGLIDYYQGVRLKIYDSWKAFYNNGGYISFLNANDITYEDETPQSDLDAGVFLLTEKISKTPSIIEKLKINRKNAEAYSYGGIGIFNDDGKRPSDIVYLLSAKMKQLPDFMDKEHPVEYYFYDVSDCIKAKNLWNSAKKQIPSDEDLKLIFENDFSKCRQTVNKMEAYFSQITDSLSEYEEQTWEKIEKEDNSMKADYNYLKMLSDQWESWQNAHKVFSFTLAKPSFYKEMGWKVTDDGYIQNSDSYITKSEFDSNPKIKAAKQYLVKLAIYKFINDKMPNIAKQLNDLLDGKVFKFSESKNIMVYIHGKTRTIYESDLKKAETIVSSIDIQNESYVNKMKQINKIFPFLVSFPDGMDLLISETGIVSDNVSELEQTEIGKRYNALQKNLSDIANRRYIFVQTENNKAGEKNNSVKKDDKYMVPPTVKEKEDIENFYKKFSAAYKSRVESSIMALIGDNWQAGDGTTLEDLEDHFRSIFKVYDKINYDISDLQISKNTNTNDFTVNYKVKITGTNFTKGLEREEGSYVTETVNYINEKIKITGTQAGSFWLLK